MSRFDTVGLFWDDTPPPKPPKKEKVKRHPPRPFWEDADYLPGLEASANLNVSLFADDELYAASTASPKEPLIFDIECYPNYFLIAFVSIPSLKVIYFELYDGCDLDIAKLRWIMSTFCIIGFNSRNYDIPIASLALSGANNEVLQTATEMLIEEQMKGWQVLRHFKVKALECNHIDIIEVAPLSASLKLYGGRIHTKRMQDLPFKPGSILSHDQQMIVLWYCINDLSNTSDLYYAVEKDIKLRESLGSEYGIDLRSKSDAQIAEYVITSEITKVNHKRPSKPQIPPGTLYKYQIPPFIEFKTPLMNSVLGTIRESQFIVADSGRIGMPDSLSGLEINIGNSVYRMGVGGLHSSEKSTAHYSSEKYILLDRDVVSYYPFIILNLRLFPSHLGSAFLRVFEKLVHKRLAAKKAGNKRVANSLKITINGTFGKLGSPYSILYSPDLLIQVTLTGQLSLLMLIERIELAGIAAVSANTDGVVIKCPREREPELNAIVAKWESDTQFNTEETRYTALHSRDVNNYIAICESDPKTGKIEVKTKGVFAKAGLQKNPTNEVCIDAIRNFLVDQTPLSETIIGTHDFKKFLSVRTVRGGAIEAYSHPLDQKMSNEFMGKILTDYGWVKFNDGWVRQIWIDKKMPYHKMAIGIEEAYRHTAPVSYGEYLGKAVRWYYSRERDINCELVYAKSGNKVPKSEGAKPVMVLPDNFPDDINYERYITEAHTILESAGFNFESRQGLPA